MINKAQGGKYHYPHVKMRERGKLRNKEHPLSPAALFQRYPEELQALLQKLQV